MKRPLRRKRFLILLSVGALALVPATNSSVAAAAGTSDNGRVGFARNPDGGPLFTMNPDGSDPVRIGNGEHLRFSPDGTQVSFACPNESDSRHIAVCVGGADGSDVHQVVPDTSGFTPAPIDFYPTGWSPDGRLLLLDAGAGLSRRAQGIYTMHPDGSNLTRLTSPPSEQIPYSFSPDGSKILLLQGDTESANNLYVMNADGSGMTQINPPGSSLDCCFDNADWSPDSQSIAFAAFDSVNRWGDGTALYIAQSSGSDLRRLTPSGQFSVQPAWSPDGMWIAYQKAGGFGWPKIKLVHPDGSGRHDITSPSQGLGGDMVWSPDSQYLMITWGERPDYQFDIWTVRRDGTEFRQLTDTPAFDEPLDWAVAP